jgi:DNA polymerase-3 subunit gamma/tau
VAGPEFSALYRRFRPQRFDEVRGQEHVVAALVGALRAGTVGHAYLFSGPRGTGKTSTARILAKALNCEAPEGVEPCGRCGSCRAVAEGTSLDVIELDAASNNGVEAMRDLVARAGLSSPGRRKVYIVDEVHMLSTAASNALLKTLEEPPAHVVFVLATTDPHKVLPTIRSRTQHLEFRLLPPKVLDELIGEVIASAQLPVGDDGRREALREGRGSARDALSALDRIAAAGEASGSGPSVQDVLVGLADGSPEEVLVASARLAAEGQEPERVATAVVAALREAFLTLAAPELSTEEGQPLAALASRIGLARLVRGIELVGQALVDQRDAPDGRAVLDVALVRLADPGLDPSPAALAERLDRLERRLAVGAADGGLAPTLSTRDHPSVSGSTAPRPAPPPADRVPPADQLPSVAGAAPAGSADPNRPVRASPSGRTGAPPGGRPEPGVAVGSRSRPALGAVLRRESPADPGPTGREGPARREGPAGREREEQGVPVTSPAPSPFPSREELTLAWADQVLEQISARARARFRAGRWVGGGEGEAVFALPDPVHRSFCEELRPEVERALSAHFGRPIPVRLVVDEPPGGPSAGMPHGDDPPGTGGRGARRAGPGVPGGVTPEGRRRPVPGDSAPARSTPPREAGRGAEPTAHLRAATPPVADRRPDPRIGPTDRESTPDGPGGAEPRGAEPRGAEPRGAETEAATGPSGQRSGGVRIGGMGAGLSDDHEEEPVDPAELLDASSGLSVVAERVLEAFPGAEILEGEPGGAGS